MRTNPIRNRLVRDDFAKIERLSEWKALLLDVTTDLFIDALLPSARKLMSIAQRVNDWKSLKKNDRLDNATRERIYAYWFFEDALKGQYFGE